MTPPSPPDTAACFVSQLMLLTKPGHSSLPWHLKMCRGPKESRPHTFLYVCVCALLPKHMQIFPSGSMLNKQSQKGIVSRVVVNLWQQTAVAPDGTDDSYWEHFNIPSTVAMTYNQASKCRIKHEILRVLSTIFQSSTFSGVLFITIITFTYLICVFCVFK